MNRHFERITTKGTLLRTVAMLALLACTTACERNDIRTFHMGSDELTAVDENGNKLYLNHIEQWLYWEEDDDIYVFTTDADGVCKLISGANTQTAYFKSETEIGENGEFAIYPASAAVVGNSGQINLPNTITYGTNRSTSAKGTHIDSSFAKDAMPMVSSMTASHALGSDATFFHVVAGLVRIQLYSPTETTIQSIELTSVAKDAIAKKQISGVFNIGGATDPQPYVTSTSTADADCKITINDTRTIGPNGTQLLTYYVPLPATSGNGKEKYAIHMKVKSAAGYCTKNFTVDIHRRNITMLPALELNWTPGDPGTGDGGSANPTMVGSGTKDRPFQIYSAADFALIRNVMNRPNAADRKINGQLITTNTYFRVMRTDIVLTPDNFGAPFNNFTGQISFATNISYNGVVKNNTGRPLFTDVAEGSTVYEFYIGTDGTYAHNAESDFALLCQDNHGLLYGCHSFGNVSNNTNNSRLAGLCVNNHGVISGGACQTTMHISGTGGIVAGICLTNYGTIDGNFSIASAIPTGDSLSGITYSNHGTVQNCQVSVAPQINAAHHWGLIVFHNDADGIVQNCQNSGMGVVSGFNAGGGSVGGIVYRNYGVVRNCRNNVDILGGYGATGGIVAYNNAGIVYNCHSAGGRTVYNSDGQDATVEAVGGIVGQMLGGKLVNCYSLSTVGSAARTGSVVGSFDNGELENVWADFQLLCGYRELANDIRFNYNIFTTYHNYTTAQYCSWITKSDLSPYNYYVTQVHERDGIKDDNSDGVDDDGIYTTENELLNDALNRWVGVKTPTFADNDALHAGQSVPGAAEFPYYSWTNDPVPNFVTSTKSAPRSPARGVSASRTRGATTMPSFGNIVRSRMLGR